MLDRRLVQSLLLGGAIVTALTAFRHWGWPRVEVWLAVLLPLGALISTGLTYRLEKKKKPPVIRISIGVTLACLLSIYGALRLDLHWAIAANGSLIALSWGLLTVNAKLAQWVVFAAHLNAIIQTWAVPALLLFSRWS